MTSMLLSPLTYRDGLIGVKTCTMTVQRSQKKNSIPQCKALISIGGFYGGRGGGRDFFVILIATINKVQRLKILLNYGRFADH